MERSGATVKGTRTKVPSGALAQLSPEHYLRIILHRKWLVLAAFVVVSVAASIYSYTLPDIYSSETLIMVDPQKVPEAYIKSTVSGDIRNRLGTLSQQILSSTRLQKIIESLNLYPEDRREKAREDVIARMRRDITVQVVSNFGASQDLQAFRIRYSGKDPRLVAQVTNELASLFIEENLKAREQQATGTSEFLQNQLQQTRTVLETQEGKLKDFKLRHLGEMPEHQAATLQIMGQLQAQLQMESEALNRAEQQRTYLQSMMTSSQMNTPVVELDSPATEPRKVPPTQQAARSTLGTAKARLAALQDRYTDDHPEIRRLKRQIEQEEAKATNASQVAVAPEPERAVTAEKVIQPPMRYSNPVLESQLASLEKEIEKHREEQQRISKLVAQYRAKLEAVPMREQQVTNLVRDYEISKEHYKALLEKQLSAETATQLEIRQKAERFTVLDPAQPSQRPSSPNRPIIHAAGAGGGLALGILLALITEFLGVSITAPEQISAATGIAVLEVIPVIRTHSDRLVRRRRLVIAFASTLLMGLVGCAVLLVRYGGQLF